MKRRFRISFLCDIYKLLKENATVYRTFGRPIYAISVNALANSRNDNVQIRSAIEFGCCNSRRCHRTFRIASIHYQRR